MRSIPVPRFLKLLQFAAIVVGGLSGGVAAGDVAEAYRYIVPPTNFGGEVHIRTTINQSYVSNDPAEDGPPRDSQSDTIAYMPTQYLVFSKSRDIRIDIKGGRFDFDDWGDTIRTCPSPGCEGPLASGRSFIYELYQLEELNRLSGENQRLAAVGARSGHPSMSTTNIAANDANWDPDPLFDTGNVSVSARRFKDEQGLYPQWKGYYVFLIKVVHDRDQNNGYIDRADRFIRSFQNDPFFNGGAERNFDEYVEERGCAVINGKYLEPDAPVVCPDRWRESVAVDFNEAFEIAGNTHWIRTPNSSEDGHPVYMASAPSELAFNVRQNFYDSSLPSTHAQTSTGLRINTVGEEAGCRNDGTPRPRLTNTDWDRAAEVQDGPPPAGSVDNRPKAEIRFPGRGSVPIDAGVTGGPPPDGYFPSGLGRVGTFPMAVAGVGPNVQTAMNLYSFGRNNQLYMGGAYITATGPFVGPIVGCVQDIQVSPLSPRSVFSGYRYNGRDSFSVTSGHTQGLLNFRFQYRNVGSYAPQVGQADWRVEVAGVGQVGSGRDIFTNDSQPTQWNARAVNNVDMGGHAGFRLWRACVNAAGKDRCSGWVTFQVNDGPIAQILSPANNANVNHNQCTPLTSRMTDPDTGERVGARFNVTWNDSRGSNVVYTRLYDYPATLKNNGSTFSADELRVESWQTNGSNQSFVPNITLTDFIRRYVPDGVDVNWNSRGYDFTGASDLNGTRRFHANLYSPPISLLDTLQTSTPHFRWGLAAGAAYHRNTRPILDASPQTAKNLYDLSDSGFATPLTNVTDGQTVRVRTVVTNSGETPTPFYQIYDYLGSTRDFEKPKSVSIRKGDGGTRTFMRANEVDDLIKQVMVRNEDNPNLDQEGPFPTDSADYRNSAWRIDFGANTASGSLLNRAAGSSQLNPGEKIIIEYTIRANRNQAITPPQIDPDAADEEGNFQRRQPVGDSRGGVAPSDTHTHLYYQEDYCDPSVRVRKNPESRQGDVLAPWLRAGRGSVHSNEGVFGYDNLGQNNATFTVTANGSIFHFTGQNSYPGYRAANQKCRDDGRVDWRKEMAGNAQRIIDNPDHNNGQTTSTFVTQGTIDMDAGGDTWVRNGSLTIGAKQFTGVGTLVVKGDLRIRGNQSYGSDSAGRPNSLGVIVLGNLIIDKDVQNLVGTYYVSDVQLSGGNIQFDDDGCPLYNPAATNRGVVSTGVSARQLNVQGVMVARKFEFQRYHVNPGADPDAPNDAAENVYYDGRVVASTPPGFGTFRDTAAWYEIAP